MSHISLLSRSETPALFSGDALFNAGAGNCHFGGDPHALFKTFSTQFTNLPLKTEIYPGHDYFINNLKFTIDREPNNESAKNMLEKHQHDDPIEIATTIEDEMKFNVFFLPHIIVNIRIHFYYIVFIKKPFINTFLNIFWFVNSDIR